MFERFLIDTNVVSMIIDNIHGKIKEPERIEMANWYAMKIRDAPSIYSFATAAELKRWAISRKDPADGERVSRTVKALLNDSYIIHSNPEILES